MITIDGKVYRGLEEQVQYLTDQNSEKDKRLDLKLDKETVAGNALYGVQGTEQIMIKPGNNITIVDGRINATGGGGGGGGAGIDTLESVNLTYGGNTTIQYNTSEGVQMSSTGHFVYTGGHQDVPVELDIPLKAGSGISMDKAATGEYLEIKSTNGSIEVIIEASQGATQGIITSEQLNILLASDNNYIKYANEIYKLNDSQHVEGFLEYTHNGYENNQAWQKTITITISTLSWVLAVTPIQHKLTAGNNITISDDFVISASGGGEAIVSDVKVNGNSVVTSGIANIDLTPYATVTELNKKQNILTAGDNIDINENTISATGLVKINSIQTGEVYSLASDGTVSGIKTAVTPTANYIPLYNASGNLKTNNAQENLDAINKQTYDNGISAINTSLASKQDALTAGQNVSIENNVISATNTVTTIAGVSGNILLGSGLTMSGTTLSASSSAKYIHMIRPNEATWDGYYLVIISEANTAYANETQIYDILSTSGYTSNANLYPLTTGAYVQSGTAGVILGAYAGDALTKAIQFYGYDTNNNQKRNVKLWSYETKLKDTVLPL